MGSGQVWGPDGCVVPTVCGANSMWSQQCGVPTNRYRVAMGGLPREGARMGRLAAAASDLGKVEDGLEGEVAGRIGGGEELRLPRALG